MRVIKPLLFLLLASCGQAPKVAETPVVTPELPRKTLDGESRATLYSGAGWLIEAGENGITCWYYGHAWKARKHGGELTCDLRDLEHAGKGRGR